MSNGNTVQVKQVSGKWVCEPETVVAQGRSAVLKFELTQEGYAFRSQNAVVVSNPGDQFPEAAVTKSPTSVHLKDKNTASGRFKYTVYLVQNGSGASVEIDPWIENDPR